MKKNYGKNGAGHIGKNNTVIMIVSVLAVTLFIGAAMQPVTAGSISINHFEPAEVEECLPCQSIEEPQTTSKCKSCAEAVFHAVDYMKNHVKTALKGKGWYFMKSVDASILIFQGIVLGFKDSGFKPTINYKELNDTISYWVNKLCGPQQIFTVTKFLAKLGAISIGITGYLLSLCNFNYAKSLPAAIKQTPSFSQGISIFYKWIKIIHQLWQ